MKIAKVLFGLLIAMCVVMGVAFVTGEFTSSGEPPPMLRGNLETQRRLDHIWLSPALAPALADAHVRRDARGWEAPSDHVPVTVDLEL